MTEPDASLGGRDTLHQARAVWPNRAQRDALAFVLEYGNQTDRALLVDLIRQWDTSPEDSVDAVCSAIGEVLGGEVRFSQCETAGVAVLDALNHPYPDPDPEEPPDA